MCTRRNNQRSNEILNSQHETFQSIFEHFQTLPNEILAHELFGDRIVLGPTAYAQNVPKHREKIKRKVITRLAWGARRSTYYMLNAIRLLTVTANKMK